MTLEASQRRRFDARLDAAGMPPREAFCVASTHQIVSAALVAEIAAFIRVFDRVTGRASWRAAALRAAPAIAQTPRREVCFFSAWDFHLPPGGGFQLIEFNDNGSGQLFAAIVNAAYYDAADLAHGAAVEPPPSVATFHRRIADLVAREAATAPGAPPQGLALVLDEREALDRGKFRPELAMLAGLLAQRGWRAAIGAPEETRWDGRSLTFDAAPVAVVVNRSTDFFWDAAAYAALREAYAAGVVTVAPNPFSYATRSDKRLLEWLSLPDWDAELGVAADERAVLAAHVPETRLLGADNLDRLAAAKRDLVFKPLHGFAGRGVLDSAGVGRARLRQLVRRGEGYVAQRRIDKPSIALEGAELWTDLRVWAYRGEILALSGRASTRPDRLDLAPPGGWMATYVGA